MVNPITSLIIEFNSAIRIIAKPCAVDPTGNWPILTDFIHHIFLTCYIPIIVNGIYFGVRGSLT